MRPAPPYRPMARPLPVNRLKSMIRVNNALHSAILAHLHPFAGHPNLMHPAPPVHGPMLNDGPMNPDPGWEQPYPVSQNPSGILQAIIGLLHPPSHGPQY